MLTAPSPRLIDASARRAAAVAEAMSWVGTPYHHHGRVKGAGVDCAQILVAVFSHPTVAMVPAIDLGMYAPQWFQHRGEELYLDWLAKAGAHLVDEPQPGDVGVWRFGRTFSHGGIVVSDGADPQIAHALAESGRVIVSRASDSPLGGREHQWWSVFP